MSRAGRAGAAARATAQRQANAQERRERYRVNYLHLPPPLAAAEMGLAPSTIYHYRVAILGPRPRPETPRPKRKIALASRTEAAAHATWKRQVNAWQRREQYRISSMHLGADRAAEELGVSVRTIRRWHATISEGRHTKPAPWQSPNGSGT